MANVEGAKAVSIAFRIAALGLAVAAAVVMATASQYVIVDAGGRRGSSSYSVSYSQYNTLVYFVAAGAVSAVCSAVALYLSAVCSKPTGAAGSLVALLDAAAQAFLFSAAGAAFATRFAVGGAGAGAAGPWGSGGGSSGARVCDVAGAFCGKVTTAAAVGAFAAVAAAVAALAKDARRAWGGCCDL